MAAKVLSFRGRDKTPSFFEMNDEKWQWTLPIEVRYVDALLLVAQLGLALKHPDNDGQAAEAARNLGKALITRFLKDIPEFTMDFVRMLGWDKVFELV